MKRHWGPPIRKRDACENFLRKHIGASDTVSGPRVERGRWVVEIERKHRDVVSLLKEELRDGGRRVGVADLVSQAISQDSQILVNREILELYSSHSDFARFLTEYLKGKPRWLK